MSVNAENRLIEAIFGTKAVDTRDEWLVPKHEYADVFSDNKEFFSFEEIKQNNLKMLQKVIRINMSLTTQQIRSINEIQAENERLAADNERLFSQVNAKVDALKNVLLKLDENQIVEKFTSVDPKVIRDLISMTEYDSRFTSVLPIFNQLLKPE